MFSPNRTDGEVDLGYGRLAISLTYGVECPIMYPPGTPFRYESRMKNEDVFLPDRFRG